MKFSLSTLLALSILPFHLAFAGPNLGFLLNEHTAIVLFEVAKDEVKQIDPKSQKPFSGRRFNVFFDGKNLGAVELKGPAETCFMDNEHQVACPAKTDARIQVDKSEDFLQAKIPAGLREKIAKPFASKRMEFSWGALAKLRGIKRPLVISDKDLKDPESWRPAQFSHWPPEVRGQILKEVLAHRREQKCTLSGATQKVLEVSEKDLEVQRAFQNKKGDRRAVAVKVKSLPQLAECDGNEMGIPSALVIQADGQTTDLLRAQEWNFRDLEVLEAADLNGDGISELFFVDYGYNRDGFSIYDFKSKKLTSVGFSSH